MFDFGKKVVDPTAGKQLDPKGRTVLGRPVTKAGGRAMDLRGAGYRGWVDQNGNRVSDAGVDAQMGAGFSARLRATNQQEK